MEIHRSYFYYRSVKDDSEVEEAIRIAGEYGDGFEKIYQRLRHDGYPWNHKKVYRVYKKIHFKSGRTFRRSSSSKGSLSASGPTTDRSSSPRK